MDTLLRTLRRHWPDVQPGEVLGGGFRNLVVEAKLHGNRVVARWSRRDERALNWELQLLMTLHVAGMIVPVPVPSDDDRLGVEGVSVVGWVEGDPPERSGDWQAVAAELRRLHALSRGWPQRPGFASTRELLAANQGGDVDLTLMPADGVERCRAAWRAITDERQSVVHGDPGAQNLRISRYGVGFIDWDEARVDASILDFAARPLLEGIDVTTDRRRAVFRAGVAWEAANGWIVEPDYARRMLAMLW